MTSEFKPESIESLRDRFPMALEPLYLDGDFSTPGKNPQHVFDFTFGALFVRFIVARVVIGTPAGPRHAVIVGMSEPTRFKQLTPEVGGELFDVIQRGLLGDAKTYEKDPAGVWFYYFTPPAKYSAEAPPFTGEEGRDGR